MLTTEAFNALLKTLEEPPPHVIFILCTTEPQKVPETIVSRCFHISFKLATQQELLSSFTRIAKKEKLDFEKEALSFSIPPGPPTVILLKLSSSDNGLV